MAAHRSRRQTPDLISIDDDDDVVELDSPPRSDAAAALTNAFSTYVEVETSTSALCRALKEACTQAEAIVTTNRENYAHLKARDSEIRRLKSVEQEHKTHGPPLDRLRRKFKKLKKTNTKLRLKIIQMKSYQRLMRTEAAQAKDIAAIECAICMETHAHVVFQPCKHMTCCEGCARTVNVCPICRVNIRQRIVAFVP